jgi:thiamine-phosphate pyrophosphorylase
VHPLILRIIDANINRISEGLRVLEDIARFIVEDTSISQKLKMVRHNLNRYSAILGLSLISSRESEADIGSNFDLSREHQDLSSVVQANARRAQEGIRVLEELFKLPDLNKLLTTVDLRKARFQTYSLERELLAKLSRKEKLRQLTGVYLIIDLQNESYRDINLLVSGALRGGAKAIGIRGQFPNNSKIKILDLYKNIKTQCELNSALFILHDQLDLALACHPDCLCMENIQTPVNVLRKKMTFSTLIGRRAETIKLITRFIREGVDFIFFSNEERIARRNSVKKTDQFNLISQYCVQVSLVLMSTVKLENLSGIMSAGVRCIAIDGSQIAHDNIKDEVKRLVNKIEKERKKLEKTGKNI